MWPMGSPEGSVVKNSPTNAGEPGSITGLGRSPGDGDCNPLQYSCLENSMVREAWQATVHGVAKSQTQLSDYHIHTYLYEMSGIDKFIETESTSVVHIHTSIK